MTTKELNALKLRMKKAIFAGNTFIHHLENFGEITSDYSDGDLVELVEKDSELSDLVDQLEEIGEKLSLV